tara:strand:+ start:1361 stop:1540 length:180 start_codon:yes stop_codon:yes gene_type:complete
MKVEEHISAMEELFGTLPEPEHHPKRFAYLVKLYKFYLQNSHKTVINNEADQKQDHTKK